MDSNTLLLFYKLNKYRNKLRQDPNSTIYQQKYAYYMTKYEKYADLKVGPKASKTATKAAKSVVKAETAVTDAKNKHEKTIYGNDSKRKTKATNKIEKAVVKADELKRIAEAAATSAEEIDGVPYKYKLKCIFDKGQDESSGLRLTTHHGSCIQDEKNIFVQIFIKFNKVNPEIIDKIIIPAYTTEGDSYHFKKNIIEKDVRFKDSAKPSMQSVVAEIKYIGDKNNAEKLNIIDDDNIMIYFKRGYLFRLRKISLSQYIKYNKKGTKKKFTKTYDFIPEHDIRDICNIAWERYATNELEKIVESLVVRVKPEEKKLKVEKHITKICKEPIPNSGEEAKQPLKEQYEKALRELKPDEKGLNYLRKLKPKK
jgi:hypothetical protein